MFNEAIGYYRDRTVEAFNPLYWVETLIYLPRTLLSYIGVNPENVVVKSLQVLYWLISPIVTYLYVAYESQIDNLLNDLIERVVP